MSFAEKELPEVWLGEGDDMRCSRMIEAGIYAQHLLDTDAGGRDVEALTLVVDVGRGAAERFWWVGVRMAVQAAARYAPRSGLPLDDLIQEGCLAVAEAIRRYDHTRGVRFSTLAHGYIQRAMAGACDERMGQTPNSRWDRRAARLAQETQEALAGQGRRAEIGEAARIAGVTPSAALRGLARLVPLDDAFARDPLAEAHFESVDARAVDFLNLLSPRSRSVLAHRFGIGCPPLTLAETARRLGTSTSTVFRWEREALAEARRLLSRERTTAAPTRDAAVAV